MADQRNGGIAWTDETWNPVTGCTRVSEGCRNCYAERVFPRAYANQNVPAARSNSVIENTGIRPRRFTDVVCHPDRLEQPLHWRKPRRVFVNSMSDLFHESVPDEFIDQVFKVMAHAPKHTFQILTKRPERMRRIVPVIRNHYPDRLDHVWLGVAVEDQATAVERIPLLLQTPAAVRFVSIEPMLGPVDLSKWLPPSNPHLDWVICGGES